MTLRSIRVTLVAMLLLLGVGSAVPRTSAYIPNPIRVSLSGPSGVVRCDRTVVLTAKVIENKTRKPISFQNVTWEIIAGQSSSDRLSDAKTSTDKKGKTSVTLTFGPAAGTRRIRATAAQESDAIVIRCAGGLPVTSTDVPGEVDPATDASVPAPALAVLLVASGLALLGRRRARAWLAR